MRFARSAAVVIALCATLVGKTPAYAADPPRVAFFGFAMINTSLEATKPEEETRLRMLEGLVRKQLDASGRFSFVAVSPELQQEIARGPEIRECNGCERDYARKAGADVAAWGTVHKISNLILSVSLQLEDAQTGKTTFAKSVSIRGNTDESWRRGLEYMLHNYLLGEP